MGPPHSCVTEDVSLVPRIGYAASNVAQEHFAASWARASGGQVTALRFHSVYDGDAECAVCRTRDDFHLRAAAGRAATLAMAPDARP